MTEQLTREKVQAMEPGRELDALVAEKVMGLPIPYISPFNGEWVIKHEEKWKPLERLQNYSTDISAAAEVVGKMRELVYDVALESMYDSLNAGGDIYHVRFFKRIEGDYAEYDSPISFTHGISVCAVLAVMDL